MVGVDPTVTPSGGTFLKAGVTAVEAIRGMTIIIEINPSARMVEIVFIILVFARRHIDEYITEENKMPCSTFSMNG